jgi:S1-C subfamily serine protease
MTEAHSTTRLQDISTDLTKLVAAAAPSVVAISSHRSRSNGFIWRQGLIVTADEALAEEGNIEVTFAGGGKAAAKVVGRDPATDITVLRVERTDIQPLALVPAGVSTGQLAIAVGADDGTPVAAQGIVSRASGPWQSMRGGDIDARIDLDISLRRSDEGSIVLDAAGQAIGMAVFGPRHRILVIPAATIERIAATLESHGRIARGYLGLGLQPVSVEGGDTGVMVMTVDPKGPGAAAGLHQGDILVTWDGKPINHVRTLLRALGPASVGQQVTLGLRRAGEARELPLKIGERPAA